MWLLGTLFYDCFCQQSTCRRRCEGSIHACFMVFTRCTQVGTRVSSRTCISSILPAGPSQVRASAAPAPPSLQENQGDFLSFLRLSWEVPPWVLSVSSWLFQTFSSSSWGFGAHVQHHQVLPVPWGETWGRPGGGGLGF